MSEQDNVHAAIESTLELEDGEILTGWVVCYETTTMEGESNAGHLYGPQSMTSWRALGLLEWVRMLTIPSSLQDD